MVQYPQQCLWMSIAVYNSSIDQRKAVCRQIYNLASDNGKNKKIDKLIKDFHKLVDLLKNVCNHKNLKLVESMKETFKELFVLFDNGKKIRANLF